MKKAVYKINTRQITAGGKYKPTAPMWAFVNTGITNLVLNDNYILKPGESFGVDLAALVAICLAKGIPVENETEFEVEFKTSAGTKTLDIEGQSTGTAHLIETFIELK